MSVGHFADRFLENRARLAEVVRAKQRVAEPLVDLREIGAADQRGLPRARRLPIVPGRGKGRGHERQRRRRVALRLDGALEAQFGLRVLARAEMDDALIERRLHGRRHALTERRKRLLLDRGLGLERRLHDRVVHRQEQLGIHRRLAAEAVGRRQQDLRRRDLEPAGQRLDRPCLRPTGSRAGRSVPGGSACVGMTFVKMTRDVADAMRRARRRSAAPARRGRSPLRTRSSRLRSRRRRPRDSRAREPKVT